MSNPYFHREDRPLYRVYFQDPSGERNEELHEAHSMLEMALIMHIAHPDCFIYRIEHVPEYTI